MALATLGVRSPRHGVLHTTAGEQLDEFVTLIRGVVSILEKDG